MTPRVRVVGRVYLLAWATARLQDVSDGELYCLEVSVLPCELHKLVERETAGRHELFIKCSSTPCGQRLLMLAISPSMH